MPESGGRSPAAGFLAGVGLAAGASAIAWLAYQQLERARFANASTFDFRRIDWLWIQALFVVAGALFGLIIVLALRGPSGSRRAMLFGGMIPPVLLLAAFWWFLYLGLSWMPAGFKWFIVDQATQTAAAIALGILLTLAVVPVGSHRSR